MEEVDKQYLSPNQRAEAIHAVLKEHIPDATMWDVVCFCVEMLGIASLDPGLQPVIGDSIKVLSRQIYSIHYFNTEELFSARLDVERARVRNDSAAPVSNRRSGGSPQNSETLASAEGTSDSRNGIGLGSETHGEDSKGSVAEELESKTEGNAGNIEGD
jgi:hypothetical protein